MRFRPNMLDNTKREIERVAGNINSDANSAFRAKKGEIEDMPLFKKYSEKLTTKEVKRSQDIGLAIGASIVLGLLVFFMLLLWWFL